MVKKETINEIIDKILSNKNDLTNKCGKIIGGIKSSLNNKIRSTLNKFFDETKKLPNEKVCYMDNQGNILLSKDGDEHSWHVSSEELTDMVMDNITFFRNHNEGGHITHNHPHVYNGAEDNSMDFTCLSRPDVNNLKNKWTDTDGTRRYLNESITADCSNGTRMTLTRQVDDFNTDKFDYLYTQLDNHWGKYIKDSKENTIKALDEYFEEYQKTNDNLPPSNELKKVKQDAQKEFAKQHFKEYIQKDINDYKELGFELSFEFLKT